MNLQSYIYGNRYGKEAHQLEREAMDDPFLQDAIDGYDQVNDQPANHLKKLKKQVVKKTRNYSYNFQPWNIAAGIIVIICVSIVFLLYSDKAALREQQSYIEPRAITATVSKNIVDTIEIEKTNQQLDSFVEEEKEKSTFKQENNKISEENLNINRRQISKETYDFTTNYTLSENEIETILSRYNPKIKTINNIIIETSKPAIGEKEYNDYIEKNRNQLTGTDCEQQHGVVILVFRVNAQGRPLDISVLRSLCQAADREAVRLLRDGPNWTVSEISARLQITF